MKVDGLMVEVYVHLGNDSEHVWQGSMQLYPETEDLLSIQLPDYRVQVAEVQHIEWSLNNDGSHSVHIYADPQGEPRKVILNGD